jgi:phosphoglycerol transferase
MKYTFSDFFTRSELKLERHSLSILIAGTVAVFLVLLFRNMGFYAFVSDEYSYSQMARLLPLSEATVPIYLYLGIYRATNYCGDGFLGCARLLNASFFVATIPLIYAVARRFSSRWMAAVVALFIAAGPINSYTAYFMPESPYFFFFWIFTWFLLRRDIRQGVSFWLVAGALLALLMLIKPHAIFLLPGALIFSTLKYDRTAFVPGSRCIATPAVIFFASFVFVRVALGFLIAGTDSVTLFGSVYGSVAESASSNSSKIFGALKVAPKVFFGHMLALAVLYGVPSGVMICTLLSVRSRDSLRSPAHQLSIYSCLVLGSLLATTALFTASVVGSGPHETASRLHLRYYSFALPLLLVVAAGQLHSSAPPTSRRSKVLVAFPIGILVLYCLHSNLRPFAPNFIDSPDFIGLIRDPQWFWLISVTSLLCLAAWIWDTKVGVRSYFVAVVPLSLFALTVSTTNDLRSRIVSDPYVEAGIFARQYLHPEETSQLIVAGADLGQVFRTLLYFDRPKVKMVVVPTWGSPPLENDTRWLLRIGEGPAAKDAFFEITGPGYSLSRIGDPNRIDFKEGFWPGIIRQASGLYAAESWGAWSSAAAVTLEFVKPLPDHFSVHLVARAIEGNAGKELRAKVGDEVVAFTLGENFEERVLPFKNPGQSNRLVIEVPPPAKQAGPDLRSLSVAFSELRVVKP